MMRHRHAALTAVLLVACFTLGAAQCGPDSDLPYPDGTTECPTGGGGDGGGGDGGGPPGGAPGGSTPAFTPGTGEVDAESCPILEGTCGKAGDKSYVSRDLAYDKTTGKLSGTITTNQ